MRGQSPVDMMQTSAPRLRRSGLRPARSRPRYWTILAPVLIVIAVAVAWSWLWYEAAAVANRTLAGWVEREAAAGRVYSCSAQSIDGFPFSIRAHCADAGAEIKKTLPPYAVQAAAINFAAEVYHPTRLTGDVVGPLTAAELGQPPSLSADWKRAELTVSGVPPNPDTLSFLLEAPHVDRIGGAGAPLFQAQRVDLRGRIVGGSPGDHPVIEVTLRVAAAAAPTFHPLVAEPLGIELDAMVRGFKDLAPKPWAERFREMQAAGGGIEIKAMRLTQADAIVVGTGTLTINANGKLDGLLRVAIAGLEHIVPRLGIDRMIGNGIDQLAGGGGTLDRLMPGLGSVIRDTANAGVIDNLNKMGEPTSIDKQPAVVLPLRFADGAIYLGMLRIGELPPLF
jgi:hypothetical protein